MNSNLVYTDSCSEYIAEEIRNKLGLEIVLRFKSDDWSINDAMSIITLPSLRLAVINTMDEMSVMEIALLNFMCKPILVTAPSVRYYPMVEKSVDFIDRNANLNTNNSNFISWYKAIMEDK